MDKRKDINWLKIPANIIEEHPIVKSILIIGGAILIIAGLIELAFGGISFTYNFLKGFFQESITIVNTRSEYMNFSQLTEKNEENKNLSNYLFLIDHCGDLYIWRILIPKYKKLQSIEDFFRVEQEHLIYSVSIITDIKSISLPLHIYAYDTNVFEIQKKTASVKIISDDDNVVGKTDVIMEIDLRTLLKKHEALFNIVPKKDIPIYIDCMGIECKKEEIKYMLVSVPQNIDSLDIFATNIGRSIIYFPERNFNKTTIYGLDVKTKQFQNIIKDTGSYFLSFEPKRCNPEGRVYFEP